jgi:hypothetical protein
MNARCQALPDAARARLSAGAQTRAMTLHLWQATQAARPPVARIRPMADASGSEWPHGNRMLDAVFLTEDEPVAMAPSLCARILYPHRDSGGHSRLRSQDVTPSR